MDPLSGAASIFAVVSLAVQLAQSAKSIKQILDAITHASEAATRLRDIVLQVYYIASSVENFLEERSCSEQNDNYISNVHSALQFCKRELETTEDVLRIAEKIENGKTPIIRGWASVRLACTSDQLDKFTGRLENAMSFLNATLLLSVTHSNTVLHSKLDQFTHSVAVLTREELVQKTNHHEKLEILPTVMKNTSVPSRGRALTASVRVAWSFNDQIELQYYKLNKRKSSRALIFRMTAYRNKLLTLQLAAYSELKFPISCRISMRNRIPDDAAILMACKDGNADWVRMLLTSNLARTNDMTWENITPLSMAISNGHEEVVQLLLREGAEVDLPTGKLYSSPLQVAVGHGMLNIARILMAHGADPTYCSAGSWSVLHYLYDEESTINSAELAAVLGYDLLFDEIKDSLGWTAMHRCAAFGTGSDIRFLSYIGASPFPSRYINNRGWTPIHVAALMNNISTLETLIRVATIASGQTGRASVNISVTDFADNDGWTPLHVAVFGGASSTIEYLLRNNADPHQRSYRTAGWFPPGCEEQALDTIDIARSNGEKSLLHYVDLLKEAGYGVSTDGDDVFWEYTHEIGNAGCG
ncbi:hypothetical protein G7054_g7172 [Neopestalotiopsis clavispora]|nr:hypothetical protein G7054_g7172 [Neopestalotiopsis clavispora]